MEFKAKQHLHAGYASQISREIQSSGTEVGAHNLMWPIFVVDDPDDKQAIASMPGVFRMGVNVMMEELEKLVPKGLKSVLLFAVTSLPKDREGTPGRDPSNPTINAIKAIKSKFGDSLLVACDVCLCPYTADGHCGVISNDTGVIDNELSIGYIAEIALAFAKAGADIVAPSDMMDGRIAKIKSVLRDAKIENKVSVLSYSTKFASHFYGPFRDAAHSAPTYGDRKKYQLPPGSRGLGVRASDRDVEEGADMLMVKPGLAYLDLVRDIKNRHPFHPMFIYQVSGEYAMLHHGATAGAFSLKPTLMEVLVSMRRAGADVIITYFTPDLLDWLKE